MEHTSCSIIGVNEDLKVQIGILDAQIKSDKKSKEEFERYLKVLNDKRDEVLARMAKNGEYVQQFDASSAQAAYRKMTSDIASIYEKAQMGHTKGIKMLEKEFGYHPSFKRPGDTFTGIAFRPMKP
jgi:ureidoglycolate hydrolase